MREIQSCTPHEDTEKLWDPLKLLKVNDIPVSSLAHDLRQEHNRQDTDTYPVFHELWLVINQALLLAVYEGSNGQRFKYNKTIFPRTRTAILKTDQKQTNEHRSSLNWQQHLKRNTNKNTHTNRWQKNHEDQNNFFFFFFCLPEDDSVPQHDIVVLRSTADSCWWIMLQTLEVSHQSLSGWGRHGAVTKPAFSGRASVPRPRANLKPLTPYCYPPALDLEHLRSGFPLPHHPRLCY